LAHPLAYDIAVPVEVTGTAISGVDYVPIGIIEDPSVAPPVYDSSVTIPAGQTQAAIAVIPLDDSGQVGDRSLTATVGASPLLAAANPGSASITIHDDGKPVVTIVADRPSATEGDGTTGDVTISRTGATDQPLLVDYSVGGSAVAGVDYQALIGSVVIPVGSLSVAIPIIPTGLPSTRGDRTVTMNVVFSGSTYGVGSNSSGTVTIHDGNTGTSSGSGSHGWQNALGEPIVSIAASTPFASAINGIPGQITLTRTGDTSQPLQVDLSFDGTAIYGVDYILTSNESCQIPAGQSSATITLQPIGTPSAGAPTLTVITTVQTSDTYQVSEDRSAVVSISDESLISVTPYYYRTRIYYTPMEWVYGYSPTVILEQDVRVDILPLHGKITYQNITGPTTGINIIYTVDDSYKQGPDSFRIRYTNSKGDIYFWTAYQWIFDPASPTLINPGDQSSSTGQTVDIQLTATDPDANPLTYTATGLPPGLSVDPIKGDIVGHADYGDESNLPYHVTITASNGNLSDNQSFLWTVTPAAPTIDNADDPIWDDLNNGVGDAVSIPIEASDPDGLLLSYSATGLPSGVTINPATGLISGTINQASDNGTSDNVVVSVSNGSQVTTLPFEWNITQDSFAPPSDLTNVVGDMVSVPIVDNDANGKTLTYTAEGLPDGLSIDPNTGVISGNPEASGAGGTPWQVTIDVSDGTETAEHSFNWTILPAIIPTIALVNPGDQTNYTDDVINLPVQGRATGPDNLQYSATGLPTGLGIDPTTGIISGMDDDFNATDGTTYSVTVTVTDDYNQTVNKTFHWQFNADPTAPNSGQSGPPGDGSGSGGDPVSSSGIGGSSGSGTGQPGSNPTTEARDDNFDVNSFWANVEKFPGGQAAKDWFASQNGQVQWSWLGAWTYGSFEKNANGDSVPFVYIPQRYNEADAATAFIANINQSWVVGFAAYSNLPKNGSPDDWQQYIKERTKAMGNVVVTGAELYLSGLSIVNEGADFIVTMNDVATAESGYQAAIAAVGILPFISNGSIRILQKGQNVVAVSAGERRILEDLLKNPNSPITAPISAGLVTALLGRRDNLWKAIKWIKPQKGVMDVVVHGTENSFVVVRNGVETHFDQRTLATYIKKSGMSGDSVRLFSCSTGASSNAIAQDLANKLGKPVQAPSDILWIHPNGRTTIGPTADVNTGQWVMFYPGGGR
jgi:hypothetical protein